MSDLIDRQAAIDALNSINGTAELDEAFFMIENLPSAQPEVIRCKDCVHYDIGFPYDRCLITDKYAEEDDFCSWAERRTDEIN
jgi:hypothetical protein